MRIAGSKIVDRKAILAKDQAIQRQIALNLQSKFDPISKAMFREKQAEKYLNTIAVSNEPTLGSLIANAKESALQTDSLQSFSLAKNNLLSVADEDTSNYILDRLDDAQINTLNQRFPEFAKVISKRYKNIDKNRFIEMIKSETFDYPENDITERAQIRIEKSDAEVRKKINEDRDEQLKGERGPANVINREQYEEYPYGNKNVTPEKNPQKEKKELTPKQRKTVYGQLSSSYPSPQNEVEEVALREAVRFSYSLKTKQEMANYIQTMIDGTVPVKFSKNELEVIVLNLKYRDEIENQQTEGYGMKRKIYGRGILQPKLSRNPDKFKLNNGKFTIDLGKLRRNILSVSYSSCRAVIPSLKKERISNDVKNMITDIIEDNYNANLFNKMKQDDQRIISTFIRTTKQDIDMSEFDTAYQNHYEILLGQINSGQNNPEIKRELSVVL